MDSYTKKSTRIIIWVIAIIMFVGTVGSFFLIILENNNGQKTQTTTAEEEPTEEQKPDPTAFKVEGDVTQLAIVDLKEGGGAAIKEGDNVRVHYKGTLAQSGVKFDSSYDTGEPVTFKLERGGLIEGWVNGLVGMKEGGKRRLIIPSELAYGDQANSTIPANSDLVFEIELIAVNPPENAQ